MKWKLIGTYYANNLWYARFDAPNETKLFAASDKETAIAQGLYEVNSLVV